MIILLPPSETKAPGGSGDPLDLTLLAWPELTARRERLLDVLERMSASPRNAAKRLGLGPRQLGELERNLELRSSPTRPAIERYTGVLYDALDVTSLRTAERRRASTRLVVCSALFGLVRAEDPIPAYRLSAGSTLPRLGTVASAWRRTLGPVLEQASGDELIVDMRSGAYVALAPVHEAVTVRVLTQRPDGSRSVVSHFNKATKGELARLLAITGTECTSIEDVIDVTRAGGLEIEQTGERSLDVITQGLPTGA